jgi:Domain of unknown function (DUF927)
MADWNAVRQFLTAVFPWPGSNDPGHGGLHFKFKTKDGKLVWTASRPLTNVQDLVTEAIGNNNLNGSFRPLDQFFCTSRQTATKTNKRGFTKAHRDHATTVASKSIFLDLDIDPTDPKKYPDVPTAIAAFDKLRKVTGLPLPSAIVLSGGGVHIYWISKTPLTPDEWYPYSNGLKQLCLANAFKFDHVCTGDITRILRIPGTFNYKFDPPVEVQLLSMGRLYDFPTALDMLPPLAAPRSAVTVGPKVAFNPFFEGEGFDAASFKQKAQWTSALPTTETLVEKERVNAIPILQQCGFYKDMFKTGGANQDQYQWMLGITGTTFMENGHAIAHTLSKGHRTYTAADTDAMFDRKMAEGIGYPQCSTIAGSGCSSCASCPLFGKIKSPLNIRSKPAPITAPVTPTKRGRGRFGVVPLPYGYDRNDDGIVCKIVSSKTDEDKGDVERKLVPLFYKPVDDFWPERNPDCIHYTTLVDGDKEFDATLLRSDMTSLNLKKALASPSCRTLPTAAGFQYLEDFFMSLLSKLWAMGEASDAEASGWYEPDGKIEGFIYGGTIYQDDGTQRASGYGNPKFKAMYTPRGDLQPWLDSCRINVTDRKRPCLTAIMLIAFAAPLIKLIGKDATMFSVWGDTATGKSSAYKVGMAVWGHPKKTKGSAASTRNGITSQMAFMKHLPFYWDEIRLDKIRDLVAEIMHEATDGVEKARMLSGQESQDRGMWNLPMVQASNDSFVEYLQDRNPKHSASYVRVLEWRILREGNPQGQLPDAVATQALAKLESNYGHAGAIYAQYLAMNHAQIEKELIAEQNAVQAKLNANEDERYWQVGATVVTLAARYAKAALGLDVDEQEIREFMEEVYLENRRAVESRGFVNGTQVDNSELIVGRYIKERGAAERLCKTDYIHLKQGRPPKPVTLLQPTPTQTRNFQGAIDVRIAVENELILIAVEDFEEWCKDKKHSYNHILNNLKKQGAKINDKIRLLSGTPYLTAGKRENTLLIPAPPGTSWNEYIAAPDIPGMPEIETGITAAVTEENAHKANAAVIAAVQAATRG